ncbi:MAG TPA: BPSS1780 family membrane protein [Usitatibacter sp.]|jgi:uncharacterized membrane protein
MSMIEADSPGAEPRLALPARRCPAGAGWSWIVHGWRLFARAPLMWILAVLVWVVIAVVVNFLPIVGGLVFQAVNGAIAAGFIVACRSIERGGEFELEHLFAGFRDRFVSLLVVGLIVMAGYVAIFLVFGMSFGFSILGALMTGDPNTIASSIMASALTLALGGLVALALTIPLMAAFWFAPALVIMHGLGPVQAMKESFVGCMRNWIPFLVWSVVMTIFAIVAALPVLLGYLVWIPLAIASTYAAYRDIYTEREPDAPFA